MSKRLLIPLLTVVAGLISTSSALAATATASTENWAGYVVTPKQASGFTAVSGEWTEPAAKCTSSGADSYAAFWVGLGGGSEQSDALEQIGTQAQCNPGGTTSYYAWYELVPSTPVKLKLTVHTGDRMYGRVAVSGDQVTLTIDDQTSGQSFTRTMTMTDPAPDTSTAEWVAEAPSECAGGTQGQCTPLTLADFGSATFSDAHATAGGHTGPIDDSAWTATRMELTPSASSLLDDGYGGLGGYGGYGAYSSYSSGSDTSKGAAPSTLKSQGTSFTVKYGSSISTTATTTTGDPGQGYGYYGGSGYGYGYGYGGGFGGYGYGGYGYGGYGGYGYGGYGGYYGY